MKLKKQITVQSILIIMVMLLQLFIPCISSAEGEATEWAIGNGIMATLTSRRTKYNRRRDRRRSRRNGKLG